MSLPFAIEYLLTLERPGKGRLVYVGYTQIVVPIFPPNTSIILTTTPWGNDFGFIPYYAGFGPTMVPDAFNVQIQQYGTANYRAAITAWTATGLYQIEGFLLVTQAEPTITTITNISALNQYYEGFSFYLRISSEEDWGLVQEALAQLKRLNAVQPPIKEI